MSENENSYLELDIKSRIWLNKEDDLFDFQSTEIKTKNYTLKKEDKENYIIKYKLNNIEDNNNILSLDKLRKKIRENPSTKIISVLVYNSTTFNFGILNSYKKKNNEYIYKPNNCGRMWSYVEKDEFTDIKEGDIIKLGRLRLQIDEICFKNYEKKPKKSLNSNLILTTTFFKELEDTRYIIDDKDSKSKIEFPTNSINKTINEKKFCRLCYQEEEDNIMDPLISPCKCNGSMKYIHYLCLKKLLQKKMEIKKSKIYDLYFIKNYCCEICLNYYPKYIKYNSNIYYLIDIDYSKHQNYVVLSIKSYYDATKNDHTLNKYISYLGYIIFRIDNDKEIKIGRSKENNNISLDDISISRLHCVIRRENNKLKIRDNGSKFGTMIYIKNIKIIPVNKKINLLSGKHQFIFELKYQQNLFGFFNNWFTFNCCSCKEIVNDKIEFNMKKRIKIDDAKKMKSNEDNESDDDNYYKRFKDSDSYNDYFIDMDKD